MVHQIKMKHKTSRILLNLWILLYSKPVASGKTRKRRLHVIHYMLTNSQFYYGVKWLQHKLWIGIKGVGSRMRQQTKMRPKDKFRFGLYFCIILFINYL